jgi:hypothetical protein
MHQCCESSANKRGAAMHMLIPRSTIWLPVKQVSISSLLIAGHAALGE